PLLGATARRSGTGRAGLGGQDRRRSLPNSTSSSRRRSTHREQSAARYAAPSPLPGPGRDAGLAPTRRAGDSVRREPALLLAAESSLRAGRAGERERRRSVACGVARRRPFPSAQIDTRDGAALPAADRIAPAVRQRARTMRRAAAAHAETMAATRGGRHHLL